MFQIGSLRGYYLFEHPRVHKRSLTPHQQHHKNLKNEPKVKFLYSFFVLKIYCFLFDIFCLILLSFTAVVGICE